MTSTWILKSGNDKIAELITNRSISLNDAINMLGMEQLEKNNADDPDYIYNGFELWFDDLTIELKEE